MGCTSIGSLVTLLMLCGGLVYLRKLGNFVLDYLQHYAECSEKELLQMDHLRWCITVPSDWSSDSKEFQSFHTCLESAGLLRGQAFDMFRESHAAARHCYVNYFSSANLEKGDKICVLDVGSGNVHMYSACALHHPNLQKHKIIPGTCPLICGKVGFSSGQSSDADSSLYISLLDADLEYLKADPSHSIHFPCCVDSNDTDIHFDISSSYRESIFKPLVDEVVSFLQEQLQEKKLLNVKRLFVVGGYAKHGYLMKEIKKSFPGFIIDTPRNPGSAVCKGAVALGLMRYSQFQARTQQNNSSNSEGGGAESNLDGGTRYGECS